MSDNNSTPAQSATHYVPASCRKERGEMLKKITDLEKLAVAWKTTLTITGFFLTLVFGGAWYQASGLREDVSKLAAAVSEGSKNIAVIQVQLEAMERARIDRRITGE